MEKILTQYWKKFKAEKPQKLHKLRAVLNKSC